MVAGELRVEAAEERWISAEMRDALTYWRGLSGDRMAPSWDEFDMAKLPARVVPWSVVVEVAYDANGEPDFICTFWGQERARLLGHDMTGRSMRELPAMRDKVCAQYKAVLERRQALYFSHEHELPNGLRPAFESLRLPLSSDGRTVDHIYSVTRFAELTAGHYEVFGVQGVFVQMQKAGSSPDR